MLHSQNSNFQCVDVLAKKRKEEVPCLKRTVGTTCSVYTLCALYERLVSVDSRTRHFALPPIS